jgi:two-component sensor histidine kinase
MAARLPETGVVFIVDKLGDVVADTVSFPSPVNVSDREWFKALLAGKTEPYVGRAMRGRSIHTHFFPVARSLRGPNNDLIGAAQIGVEAAYIAGLVRSLNMGAGAYLGIYRTDDGAVVARFPMSEALLEETVSARPYFSGLATSGAESWTGWTGAEPEVGGKHLVSARRLHGWPLIVTASIPGSAVYASAWVRLLWHAILAALLVAALLLLASLAVAQARREAALMRELQHRVKNMLASVMAVVQRAREGAQSSETFIASLQNRLQSMATTQALLAAGRSGRTDLATLIRAELAPYATPTNAILEGPPVPLAANAAHVLAMTFHELATNAAKYGALSKPGGHVSLRWTVEGVRAPALTLVWEESGGPEVTLPVRQGYGSELVRELVGYELGGTVELVFARQGVRCALALPISAISS